MNKQMNTKYDKCYMEAIDLINELLDDSDFIKLVKSSSLTKNEVMEVVGLLEEYDQIINENAELS